MGASSERWQEPLNWPQIEAHWNLEPELRSPVPRRVVPLVGHSGCKDSLMTGCLSFFMLLLFMLGLLLCIWAGLSVLIMPLGTVGKATITAHQINGGDESYFLRFRFQHRGQSYVGEWPVESQTYSQLHDGATTPVRYFAFMPGLRPVLERGFSPWLYVMSMGIMGMVLLVMSGIYLVAVFWPRRGKKLVRFGQPVCGIVIERFIDQGVRGAEGTFLFDMSRSSGIVVAYVVADRTWEKRVKYFKDEVQHIAPGQTLTMLVSPRRPKEAYPYLYCEYRAEPTTLSV